MPDHRFHLSRRGFLGLATVSALLPLAACQTVTRTPGKSAGVSTSAASLVQNIRSSNGLAGLTADSSLESAALQQAGYMASAGRMSHTTGWGRDFATRVRNNEIHGIAAENIAVGRMNSTGSLPCGWPRRRIAAICWIRSSPGSALPIRKLPAAAASGIGPWSLPAELSARIGR